MAIPSIRSKQTQTVPLSLNNSYCPYKYRKGPKVCFKKMVMHIQTFHVSQLICAFTSQKEGSECQEERKFRNCTSRKCQSTSLEAREAVKIPSRNRKRHNRKKNIKRTKRNVQLSPRQYSFLSALKFSTVKCLFTLTGQIIKLSIYYTQV